MANENFLSLLVDEIGKVLSLDDTTYELPPPNLAGALGDLILGVYKVDDK